jgi:hypothetical protein
MGRIVSLAAPDRQAGEGAETPRESMDQLRNNRLRIVRFVSRREEAIVQRPAKQSDRRTVS